MPDALLNETELIACLATGATVVTPNRRLAQTLGAEFDRTQIGRGRAMWEAPDILPYAAFVERAYDHALYSEAERDPPQRLTEFEERSLWEDAVRRSEAGSALLAGPETAGLAREAWQLAHAWRLWPALERAGERGTLNDDTRAFLGWAGQVRGAMQRGSWIDGANLPDWVAARFDGPALKLPRQLVRWGFDLVTPQQAGFFDALERAGVAVSAGAPVSRTARAVRYPCADARAEIRAAANWARARLEDQATARIGVVVHALARHRNAIARAFAQTLAPGMEDPRAAARVLPFNLSLGEPLDQVPLIAHALRLLQLLGREIEFGHASTVLRSPFIAAAEAERDVRAQLDAALRRRAEPLVNLDRLIALLARAELPRAPVLTQKLAALAEYRRARLFGAQPPRAWSEAFTTALAVAGFPGERTLDSAEYQALQKWHAMLADFARLDRVLERTHFADALARLRRTAAATLFQAETPEVPIQVLGVLEAAGMTFDHLWVMGLSDEEWPVPARANPFLPIGVQREAGLGNASPAAALETARRLTAGWISSASEVVLSHPRRVDDRDLAPSPLIAQVPEGTPVFPDFERWRAAIHGTSALEHIEDNRAPATTGAMVAGGVAVIRDQAACPFRALAIHRLGADEMAAPHTGLDALERGILVHRVLASVWRELKTRAALMALSAPALDALLGEAAQEAIAWQRRDRPTTLGGRFADVEQGRLVRIARAWLEEERHREDFTVLATEDKRTLALGPLTLNVRLDRVDATADNVRIVIDYKTGRPTLAAMLGPRPAEPQLPLYVTAAEPDAGAVAFAQVRAGDMKFVGLAREDGLLPGARRADQANRGASLPTWDAQRAFWRAELERLAQNYADGHAEVDPVNQMNTCRGCGVRIFCRIHEHMESGRHDHGR